MRSPLFLSAPPPSGGATATIARTGKRYDQRYIGVTQVRDGKIVLHREYWNPSVVLEAFGDPGYLGETFNTSG